jgi:photosystem II stability/assembly factor-like uncharacterized protein
VLYVNDGVGAIDLVINRKRRRRCTRHVRQGPKPWQIVESGPRAASTDDNGGDKWTAGRRPADGKSAASASTLSEESADPLRLLENQNQRAPARAAKSASPLPGIIGNELYRTDDGGKTWRKATDVNVAGGKAPYSFNQIRINPHNDQTVIVTSDSMYISRDGGKTWDPNFFRGAFGDFRCDVVGSDDEQRIISAATAA